MSEHTKLPPKMLMIQIGATPMWGIYLEGETSFISTDLTEKDAEFIVRAVNAHAGLVEACEAWMKVESESRANHPCPDYTLRAKYRKDAVALTLPALALATPPVEPTKPETLHIPQ